jgi:hypothetical protein
MKWINIEPQLIDEGMVVRTSPMGVVVRRYLSPYDIPDAVRAIIHDGNLVELKFRYMEDEEPVETLDTIAFQSDGVAKLGRHSNRLYSLSVRSVTPESALNRADDIISKLTTSRPSSARKYDVAKRALEAAKPQLIESLHEQNVATT